MTRRRYEGADACRGSGFVVGAAKHVGHAASAATSFAARNIGGCAGHLLECGENIKVGMTPVIMGGVAVSIVGIATVSGGAMCAMVLGCVVGAPLIVGGFAAAAYGTYKFGQSVWWGPNAGDAYDHW